MALQKQIITIPLGLGVNTKTDEKLVDAGQFNLVSENTTFDKLGASKKRTGYAPYSSDFYNPSDVAGTAAGNYATATYSPVCAATINKSMILRNQIGEYYYLHKNKFIKRSDYTIPEAKIVTELVYPGITTVDETDTDYDSDENIVIAVSRDGRQTGSISTVVEQGSTLIIFDNSKKTTITTQKVPVTASGVAATGFVKCGFSRVSSESYYYNVSVNSNNDMNIWIFNKYGQKHATTFSIAGITSYTGVLFGAIAACRSTDKTSMYFIAPTTTANTAKFVALSGTTKTFETTFTITGTSFEGAYAFYDAGLIYVYYSIGANIRLVVLNPDGTVNTANAVYIAGGPSVMGDQDNRTRLLFSGSIIEYSYYNGSSSIIQNKSFLESDKVTIGGVEIVMARDQIDNIYSTYYILGNSTVANYAGAKTIAKLLPETATIGSTGSHSYYQPSRFAKIDTNTAVIALPRLLGNNGEVTTYGMQLVFVTILADKDSFNRATIGPNVHFQGGYVAEFDGENLTENGFLGKQSAPAVNVAGAGPLTGTFSYLTVLKYTDKNGQITRSVPSLATSTGAIAAKAPVITPDSMPYGIKANNCAIEIYRTTTLGTVFYFLTELQADMYATIPTYSDVSPDANISDNTQLYTAGNVLENDPAPSCKLVCQGGNRLWVAGLEDDDEVAFSKKKLFGESVAFSDFFRIRFDSSQYSISGGITGIGYMDGSFIAFKRNSIFYVRGDGPNELGQNDTFTDPEMISADTGCVDSRSVVLTPMGLMFKGEKGIYMLERGLNTSFIGSGVEAYNAYSVTSAVLVDAKNQVIFTLLDSDTNNRYKLVYDYFSKQWSVDTGIRAVDGDIIDSEHIVLDSVTHIPAKQTPAIFSDNGTVFSSKIKTPWIKVSGIQDFGRIYSMTIVGDFKSEHTLRVTAYYDYATNYSETYNVVPLVSDSQYQYRIHLKKQKCEAVQFVIEDINPVGESMILTAISLEVGAKQGTMKLAATRKY